MEGNKVGTIIGISDLNVKILLNTDDVKINDILYYRDEANRLIRRFEIVEIDSNIAFAIPFESVYGLKKGVN